MKFGYGRSERLRFQSRSKLCSKRCWKRTNLSQHMVNDRTKGAISPMGRSVSHKQRASFRPMCRTRYQTAALTGSSRGSKPALGSVRGSCFRHGSWPGDRMFRTPRPRILSGTEAMRIHRRKPHSWEVTVRRSTTAPTATTSRESNRATAFRSGVGARRRLMVESHVAYVIRKAGNPATRYGNGNFQASYFRTPKSGFASSNNEGAP